MKSGDGHIKRRGAGRSPCGERGLKSGCRGGCTWWTSRSPCGERGLKSCATSTCPQISRRSPCGERGLKWREPVGAIVALSSLPVRGAWIEIGPCRRAIIRRVSLPVRGAWIEIALTEAVAMPMSGRSPCGERGLKFPPARVRLLMDTSLPVRGAWIEMMT